MKVAFVDEFKGQDVSFSRTGWFNATQCAARYGKTPKQWLSTPGVDGYLATLMSRKGLRRRDIIATTKQQNGGGLWMSPLLAPIYGLWLDVDLADWLEVRSELAISSGKQILRSFRMEKDYLQECFTYEPETGLLFWNEDRPASHFTSGKAYGEWLETYAGSVVGYTNAHGYLEVSIDGINIKQHRIVLILNDIEIPEGYEVDHLNGIRCDNRMHNLRVVTRAINMKNRAISSANTSGVNGVSIRTGRRPYVAYGCSEDRPCYIGSFETMELAEKARLAWQDEVGGFTKRHGKKSCDNAPAMA